MPDGQVNLEDWLATRGFESGKARKRALEALRETGVISARPRTFISEDKLARAAEALGTRFTVHCPQAACARIARERAAGGGTQLVAAASRGACSVCQGSNTRRAFLTAREACERAGVLRWLIVGGSPAMREELRDYLRGAPRLELTLDEGDSNDGRTVRARGLRAQAIAILATSQINHKDTAIYTREFKDKIVLVPARSLEALFAEMERRARGGRA